METNKNDQIEVCLAEIKLTSDRIEQIVQESRALMRKRDELRKKVNELLSANSGMVSKSMKDYELAKFVVEQLKKQQSPISLREICTALETANVDFIPPQILNLKAYVQRRMTLFCESGDISIVPDDRLAGKYYALTSWLTVHSIDKQNAG